MLTQKNNYFPIKLLQLSVAVLMLTCSFVPKLEALQESEKALVDETKQLTAEQRVLAEQYRLLEQKLFTLYEFEQPTNPQRSQLLQRAFLSSQQNRTATQLEQIVELLESSQLQDAARDQKVALKQLEGLLVLLQSEDRGQRVRDEIKRHQENLKEIQRLQRIQKGIRGQTEGNASADQLEKSQEQLADRTKQLNEKLSRMSRGELDGFQDEGNEPGPQIDGEHPQRPDDSRGNGEDQGNADQEGSNQRAEGKPPGYPAEDSPQEVDDPVRERIQAAEDRMRRAKEKLDNAKRNESIEEMEAAERELEGARRELEEILKQLREEEVERVLAMLEGRFRTMLERQIKVLDQTKKLDRVDARNRLTEFEISAGKSSLEERAIANEAARALMLLREEGSSIAFPETVEQMKLDMDQIADRLAAAKVGQITQVIEEDVIETLDYLVAALVKTQKSMEDQKDASDQGSAAGEMPLVDSLAEIKMIRGLQERIYRRHQRYSQLLDKPDDLLGESDDPEIRAALLRLGDQQQTLTRITRDVVNGKNK